MKKCLTFIALACVGMMTAGTASAQTTNTYYGADAGNVGSLGNFLMDTSQAGTSDDDGIIPGAGNASLINEGGVFNFQAWSAANAAVAPYLGAGGYEPNHSTDLEAYQTVSGLVAGTTYDVDVIVADFNFWSSETILAGFVSGSLTAYAPASWRDTGVLDDAGSYKVNEFDLGTAVANGAGEITVYLDSPGSTRFGYYGLGVSPAPAVLLGDVNLDKTVDFLDISPFIAVLSGGTFQAEADCNEDGVVDFLDISPFIAILSGSPATE